jgi:hypothetical protein
VASSIVLNGETATSYLLVLNAKDMSEVARAQVPHHVPFGFHGTHRHTSSLALGRNSSSGSLTNARAWWDIAPGNFFGEHDLNSDVM